MLATINDRQNDPHDVVDISPDIVLASRMDKEAPSLAPDITPRQEPKVDVTPAAADAAPSVDKAVRAALRDYHASRKRSSIGKWLHGAMLSILLAAGTTAAAIAWQTHGDALREVAATWMPSFTVAAAPPPAATTEPPASPGQPAEAADQAAAQTTAPAPQQDAAPSSTGVAPAAPDAAQKLESMARDVAAMTQQIEQLKSNIAELKAGQEQMTRDMTKPPPARTEAIGAEPNPRVKLTALPPHPPAPPKRKPKPVRAPAYTPAYAPTTIVPPPQAAAVAPPPPAPAPLQTADDDGPVVRPPMPVR